MARFACALALTSFFAFAAAADTGVPHAQVNCGLTPAEFGALQPTATFPNGGVQSYAQFQNNFCTVPPPVAVNYSGTTGQLISTTACAGTDSNDCYFSSTVPKTCLTAFDAAMFVFREDVKNAVAPEIAALDSSTPGKLTNFQAVKKGGLCTAYQKLAKAMIAGGPSNENSCLYNAAFQQFASFYGWYYGVGFPMVTEWGNGILCDTSNWTPQTATDYTDGPWTFSGAAWNPDSCVPACGTFCTYEECSSGAKFTLSLLALVASLAVMFHL